MSKRKHTQQYKEEYSVLWPVLKRSKVSDSYVFCTVCNADIIISHGGRNDCLRHVECGRHTDKAKLQSSHRSIKSHFIVNDDNSVILAESLFTSFLVEHNIPLAAADHAGNLFRRMFPDSTIAAKYGCARTKTTAIINSFAKSTMAEISKCLKSSKFTLATDGSNAAEDEKIFPILVTYFDTAAEKNTTMMLSLPYLNIDATGENIFNLIDKEFKKFEIPWQNCLALSSDNASVMTGKYKGVIHFMQQKNSKIIVSGCACHLIHLAAQHASKELSFPIEEFLVDIYYYLSKSSKRADSFKLCQKMCEVEIHKIIKYGSTRWLSMENVVNRILEQWEPLKVFFCDKENGESDTLLRIKMHFQNKETKLYLLFLQSILPLFSKANVLLQSEAPLVHKLRRQLISLYTECLSRFIAPHAVQSATDILQINVGDKKLQKLTEDLVIGYKTKQYLANEDLTDSAKKKFFKSVRAYYVKACSYMSKKFPFNDKLLMHAEVADISLRTEKKFESLEYFIPYFDDLFNETELDLLPTEFAQYQQDHLCDEIIQCDRDDSTWCKISSMKDHNKTTKYKVLPKIMQTILLYPHSNAACERVFSVIRKNKNDFRSNLNKSSLESLMVQKCKYVNRNLCCYSMQITKEELAKAKKATYESLKHA